MKKTLLFLLLLPVFAQGQLQIQYFGDVDSTTITFSAGDSLNHKLHNSFIWSVDTVRVNVDTSSATLWQIGGTLKTVFSTGTIVSHGIMTDTVNPYPANANALFTLKINYTQNSVISIWHEYWTDLYHAGGIVEFSMDSGATWLNIAQCPYIDQANFYSAADTLFSGDAAFMGNSSGRILSQFQFLNCFAVAPAPTPTSCGTPGFPFGPLYVRFRFLSDSTVSSFPGWKIDSIAVNYEICPGDVKNVSKEEGITLFPNPATTSLTITAPDAINQITITNLLGQVVSSRQYAVGSMQVDLDVAGLPGGVYFVRVNGSDPSAGLRMTGKFVKN